MKRDASAQVFWNKETLIPKIGSKQYKTYLEEIEKNVKKLEGYRKKLDKLSIGEFKDIIKIKEEISAKGAKVGAYSYLWFSENTGDSHSRKFMSQIENMATSWGNRTMFFNLWFKDLGDKEATKYIKAVPEYNYYLQRIREGKPYALKENEEKIINLKDLSGSNALEKIYDMITASFSYPFTINGKTKELQQEEIKCYVRSPKAELRAQAYKTMLGTYGKHGQVLGEIYRSAVEDWKNECLTLRGYKSPEQVRNIANDIPEEAYKALLKVTKKNTSLFQDYFQLKFKACGIKDKSRYHIYAPYEKDHKQIMYKDAIKMVLENFKKFSPKVHDLANKLVKEKHIYAPVQKGKRSGAYCYSITPELTPYVLLNYTGDTRDVFTLAHELGHAVHGLLARKQKILQYHAPIPLAETASIFSEMLLFEKMMQNEKEAEVKKGMLIAKLDDMYATIGRQSWFTLFEEKAHRMVAEGAGVDDLKDEYYKQLKEQFGNKIKIPGEFQWEWTYIPHIYQSPFYCYGYSFGNLLVIALYERYLKEGDSFIPHYLKMLEYGGSEKPVKVLEEAGVDITKEKFWQEGFRFVEEKVRELKKLK